MSLVRINWKPNVKERRSFGVALIIGFGIIGLIFQFGFKKPDIAEACYLLGGIVGSIGLTGTKIALPFYWLWMGIAFVMGNIMSRIILTLFYYGMITPMGLGMRLIGRDKLILRKKNVNSYWSDLKPVKDKSRYERPF